MLSPDLAAEVAKYCVAPAACTVRVRTQHTHTHTHFSRKPSSVGCPHVRIIAILHHTHLQLFDYISIWTGRRRWPSYCT